MANDLILLGGLALIGVIILKSGVLQNLASGLGGGEGETTELPPLEDLDGDGIPDTRSPNTIASKELSSPLVAVNYYAGKIAGMISAMASRNIYDATMIKEYLIDRRISEVEHIAQLVNYQIVKIDYTNLVALREIARLALDTGKELRIEYLVDDALALEVLGNVGRGYSQIPPSSRNEMVLGNVSRYIIDRFNGAPSIRIPNDQALIDEQFRDFEEMGKLADKYGAEDMDRDRDEDEDEDRDRKKGNLVKRSYFLGRGDYGSPVGDGRIWYAPDQTYNEYPDLNSAWQLPLPHYKPIYLADPFFLGRRYRYYPRTRRRFLNNYYLYNPKRYNYWWWRL